MPGSARKMRFGILPFLALAMNGIGEFVVSASPVETRTHQVSSEHAKVGDREVLSTRLPDAAVGFVQFGNKDTGSIRLEHVNTALTTALPDQPDRMVQMILSIIVSDSDFTDEVNGAVIDCLSNRSLTKPENWGLFNADRFTNVLLQAEYFAAVSEEGSLNFPLTVDEYVRSGELLSCVRDKNVGLSSTATILSGRTTLAHRRGDIVSSAAFTPGWVVGVVIGALTLVAIVGTVVFSIKESKVYSVNDYESPTEEAEKHAEDPDLGTDTEEAERKLSAELKTIAGQGSTSIDL